MFCVKNLCLEDSSLGAIILTTVVAYETLLAAKNETLLKEFTLNQRSSKSFLIGFPLFSHPSEIETQVVATQTADGYCLSGSLNYLGLAGLADKALIPALVEREAGFTYFLVDLTQAGVAVSKPVRGLGISACPISDIRLENVLAIQCCALNAGKEIYNEVSSKLSVALAAMQTGIMKGSFRDALDYSYNRRQGGRNIIHWSEIKKILSRMAINIQLAEMLVKQCCISMETAAKTWRADAIAASIRISEMANEVVSDGIQVMGGVGYMKDFHQERRFRDTRHLMSAFGIQQLKKLRFLEDHISKTAVYHPSEFLL